MPKFYRLCRVALFNHLVISHVANLHVLIHGPRTDVAVFPGLPEVLAHLAFFVVAAEVPHFYIHWAMHHKSVYKHVHKMHHEWTAPIAWEGVYCHPLEHIFLNLLSVGMGPTLLGRFE